jgi:hypothetical protein
MERTVAMPMTLIETIDSHHGALLRTLDEIEATVSSSTQDDALATAVDVLLRKLAAHEVTAERFVVGPLRHLRLLDAGRLAALADELAQLADDAAKLTSDKPDPDAVAAFVRAARAHIERKVQAILPAARSALADGRLAGAPAWYVEEVYGLQGGPAPPWPEEWLG